MKKRILCTILALALVLSATAMPAFAKIGEIHSFDFEDADIGPITNKAQLGSHFSLASTASQVTTSVEDTRVLHTQDSSLFVLQTKQTTAEANGTHNKDNDILTINKNNAKTSTYEVRYGAGTLANVLPSTGVYTLSLNMKTNFSNASGAQLAFGGNFEFVCEDTAAQELSIKYYNGTEFVTIMNGDAKHKWSFADYTEVKFVVDRATDLTDLYIAGEPAVENVPIREGKSDFAKIGIIVNKSTIGDLYIKGIQAYKAEDSQVLKLDKPDKTDGSGTTTMDYSSIINTYGAKDYTLSFDMYPQITEGSINVVFGASFEFIPTGDGVFKIMHREGTQSNALAKADVEINGYVTVKIKIENGKGNLYFGTELIDEDVEYRNTFTPEKLQIVLNKSMTGSVYIDNIKLTVEQEKDAYVEGKVKVRESDGKQQLSVEAFVPTATAGNSYRVYVAYFADEQQKKFLGATIQDVAKGELVIRDWGSSISNKAKFANVMLWNDSLKPLCDFVPVVFADSEAE